MDWHSKLYGRSITHTSLADLGISVENLRKTAALNDNRINGRYGHCQMTRLNTGKGKRRIH